MNTETGMEPEDHASDCSNDPPAALLLALLASSGQSVDEKVIAVLDSELAPTPDGADRLERIRALLAGTQLTNATPTLLPWRRFDQRLLPALVQQNGVWHLVERSDSGALTLSSAQGDACAVEESELRASTVLWIRVSPAADLNQKQSRSLNPAITLLRRELLRDRRWIRSVIVATAIVNLLAVATSLFAMQVYDRVVPTLAYATFTTLVAGMIIVIALDWTLKTLRAKVLDSLACEVDRRLSQHVFDHLLQLRLDTRPKSLGTLAAQVGGLDAVRQFFSSAVVFALVDIPFALMFVFFIGIIGGTVAWVYVAMMLVALGVGLVGQTRNRHLAELQQQRGAERQGLLVDAIRGAESIRASNAAWHFSSEWTALTQSISAHSIRQKAISTFSTVTIASLSTTAYVAAVVVGVWRIEAGLMTMGAMIACSILGGRVISPVAQGAQYLAQWQGVSQALEQVGGFLSLERERRDGQTLLMPDRPPRSLELARVRFGYEEACSPQVDIPSLQIAAGERILLLGPVGCGKSSLLKILAGIYKPAEGRVRLGDADLWEMDPQAVAAHVGYLPQTVRLFRGTLRSNLALSGTSGDSHLLDVVRDLGIETIAASHPLGLDLVVNEGGEGLSGGQKQLVALGRTIMDAPRIWLLDEPTASLDAQTEGRVWRTLEQNLSPEDILIVATHRPAQVLPLATRVLVMRDGEIVADDTPDVLFPDRRAASTENLSTTTPLTTVVTASEQSSEPLADDTDGDQSNAA